MPPEDTKFHEGLEAPPFWSVFREARFAVEILAWLWTLVRLRSRSIGRREPVLVLPGFGAGDPWTAAMRLFLNRVGFDARGWGLGRNRGNVAELIPQVIEQVAAFAEESGGRVRLVGWSLGGLIAREVARERPDLVERIVTLGSPIVGGPKYTVWAKSFRRRGFDVDAIEAKLKARDRVPIEVPIFTIYSRWDGIVSWRACLDKVQALAVPVEVRSSHLGLVVSPSVLTTVARKLVGAS